LGIFGSENLDKTVIEAFYDSILKRKPKIYHFNPEFIDHKTFSTIALPNYELNLHQSSSTIYEGYNANLKRKLKKLNSNFRMELLEDKSKILDFVYEFAKPKMNPKIRNKFNILLEVLKEKDKVETFGFYKQNTLLAVAVFLMDQNRIINLLPISNEEGKTQNAMAFLLDFIIQKNAEKELILDFEGSSIEGIAHFYKSFGAVNNSYYQFKA